MADVTLVAIHKRPKWQMAPFAAIATRVVTPVLLIETQKSVPAERFRRRS